MKYSEEECRGLIIEAQETGFPWEYARATWQHLTRQVAEALEERLSFQRDLINANKVLKDEVDQLLREREKLLVRVEELEQFKSIIVKIVNDNNEAFEGTLG